MVSLGVVRLPPPSDATDQMHRPAISGANNFRAYTMKFMCKHGTPYSAVM